MDETSQGYLIYFVFRDAVEKLGTAKGYGGYKLFSGSTQLERKIYYLVHCTTGSEAQNWDTVALHYKITAHYIALIIL